MATQAAYKRLVKEYKDMTTSPPPLMCAKPLESNILEWHFLFNGPPDTPYTGGTYWGKVVFPADYPYKPPSIRMLTPSGRFKPGQRICLSYSDYHPELWNPGWSVATILNGLLSFMTSNEAGAGTEMSTTGTRRKFAGDSMSWNRKQKLFREIWPEFCEPGDTSNPILGSPLSTTTTTTTTSSSSSSTPDNVLSQDTLSGLRNRHRDIQTQSPSSILSTNRSPTTASVVASCTSSTALTSAVTPHPHVALSFWRRYRAWLLVGGSLWLCLFIHRLSARLGLTVALR